VLRNIRPIKPFPVKGKLGLYDVEVEPSAFGPPDRSLFDG